MSLSIPAFRRVFADRVRPSSTLAWKRADRRVGAALLLPALLVFGVFVFYPLDGDLAVHAGHRHLRQAAGFVGVRNFATIFGDPQFGDTLWRTAVFCVASSPVRILVGLLIVVPLTAKLRGIRVFRALLTSPLVASVSVASVAFAAMLAPAAGS